MIGSNLDGRARPQPFVTGYEADVAQAGQATFGQQAARFEAARGFDSAIKQHCPVGELCRYDAQYVVLFQHSLAHFRSSFI